jgi:hypothetical protein
MTSAVITAVIAAPLLQRGWVPDGVIAQRESSLEPGSLSQTEPAMEQGPLLVR